MVTKKPSPTPSSAEPCAPCPLRATATPSTRPDQCRRAKEGRTDMPTTTSRPRRPRPAQQRTTARAIHLLAAALMGTYIYAPAAVAAAPLHPKFWPSWSSPSPPSPDFPLETSTDPTDLQKTLQLRRPIAQPALALDSTASGPPFTHAEHLPRMCPQRGISNLFGTRGTPVIDRGNETIVSVALSRFPRTYPVEQPLHM